VPEEKLRGYLFLGVKTLEVPEIHQSVMLLEDVGKPSFGKPAVKGHLPTFKPRTHA
jgi:hypothetical protein